MFLFEATCLLYFFFFHKLIKRVVELYITVKPRSSQVNERINFSFTSLFVSYLSQSAPYQYLTPPHYIGNKVIHCVIHGYNVGGRYIGGGRLEGTVRLADVTHSQGQQERCHGACTYILSLISYPWLHIYTLLLYHSLLVLSPSFCFLQFYLLHTLVHSRYRSFTFSPETSSLLLPIFVSNTFSASLALYSW